MIALDNSGNQSSKITETFTAKNVSISHVNLNNQDILIGGRLYQKQWLLTNNSGQTLNNIIAYTLSSDSELTAPSTINLGSLANGASKNITADLVVPNNPSTKIQRGNWYLVSDGEPLDINDNAFFGYEVQTIQTPPNNEFSDISRTSDLAGVVYNFGLANNVINPPTAINHYLFLPYEDITRADVVDMLIRALNKPTNLNGTRFNDVASSHALFNSIQTAKNLGWVSGYGNGSFGPDDNIQRYQIALILKRILQSERNVATPTTTVSLYPDVPYAIPTEVSNNQTTSQEWREWYTAIAMLKDIDIFKGGSDAFQLYSHTKRYDLLALVKKFHRGAGVY